MGLLDRYLRVRVTSAEPENLLSKLIISGVELLDVEQVDLLTIEMKIKKSQLRRIQKIIHNNGGNGKLIKREGLLWCLESVLKRPTLILGTALFLFAAWLIPQRIFFVRVTGNESIPSKMILSQAEDCGIQFAAKASMVRSEHVKNNLLSKIPQLQWIGITTSGSVATIQVKERSIQESTQTNENSVSSIVAIRDGVITEQTVYNGNPLFQVGQTVKAGDTLISGYTDCGIKLKAEQAGGEVFGYTLHQNEFISPSASKIRTKFTGSHTCIKIHIGKKVINLCNHSGILDTGCVKIYSEEYWTLPGGFQLPVSIMKTEHLYYELVTPPIGDTASFQWLSQFAHTYLKTQMVAGEIVSEKLQWTISNDACTLTGNYACHEMIGQVRYEEILTQYAKDN